MGESDNCRAVERLIIGLNAKNLAVMNEVFDDDSTIVYPQSGEVIRGRANRQAIYESMTSLPSITPYRTTASGAIVVTEAMLDYGGDIYYTVMIFEFRDGRVDRQTVYWSKPFPAADARARWVQEATPAGQPPRPLP